MLALSDGSGITPISQFPLQNQELWFVDRALPEGGTAGPQVRVLKLAYAYTRACVKFFLF